MTDYDDMKRGTSREWVAARIIIVCGLIFAAGAAGYFIWSQHKAAQEQQAEIKAEQQAAQTQAEGAAMNDKKAALVRAGAMLCALELVNAKNYGVIPGYGQLATAMPQPEEQARPLIPAMASTDVAKYKMVADLLHLPRPAGSALRDLADHHPRRRHGDVQEVGATRLGQA